MDVINSRDYVDKAENVIKELMESEKADAAREAAQRGGKKKTTKILTTTQLRKQLSMTAEMFAMAERETADILSRELQDSIEYLRVQFVYQAGRDIPVKNFIDKAKILQILQSINGNKNDFITFCRYLEALVAYKKYYINED